jgi:oligosaccharide repeat unit polymerase
MYSISMGMRSVLIQNLLTSLFVFLFLYKYFNKKILKYLKPILSIFLAVVISGFMLITISRSIGRGKNPVEFMESYLSQSFLYFGQYGFDNGSEIRYGDRTFPFFKSFISDDVARTSYERRLKYKKMHINESVFVSFVGDFVFDYGPYGAFFVLLILFFLFKCFLKGPRDKLYFDQILIIYIIIYLLSGFYLYPFAEYAGNIKLAAIILLSLFFKSRRNYVESKK